MPPKVNVQRFSRAKVNTLPTIQEELKQTKGFGVVKLDERVDDVEDEPSENEEESNEDDGFLGELANDVFVSEVEIEKQEKETKKQQKEREAEERRQERERKRYEKSLKDAEKSVVKTESTRKRKEDDELFANKATELYGRDKLQLMAKIQQYKVLFPENKQLKALKLKKNPSVEELQAVLSECEAIVETDCVEGFVTDSILASMKMVEFASTRTKYNIKGMSEMLRQNPQFTSLCKQLYLKYKVFSKTPPEAQMMLLLMSTAYVCIEKNKADEKKANTLNRDIDLNAL